MTEEDTRTVTLRWSGSGVAFESAAARAKIAVQGGQDRAAQSPMELLLTAAGSCMASDVVEILAKMRRPPTSYAVEVVGWRAADTPHRYTRLQLVHRAEGTDEASLRRAVQLSQDRYCSVMATLDPAMPIEHEFVVDGAA
jgi:putative redox protein